MLGKYTLCERAHVSRFPINLFGSLGQGYVACKGKQLRDHFPFLQIC